jgi:hypothetical protein
VLLLGCEFRLSIGAAMLNFLSNRIGEVALLVVIAWVISFGSWKFAYNLQFISSCIEMQPIPFLAVLAAIIKMLRFLYKKTNWMHQFHKFILS